MNDPHGLVAGVQPQSNPDTLVPAQNLLRAPIAFSPGLSPALDSVVLPPRGPRLDSNVSIAFGPFAGFTARVTEVQANRVVVNIALTSRSILVELDSNMIRLSDTD